MKKAAKSVAKKPVAKSKLPVALRDLDIGFVIKEYEELVAGMGAEQAAVNWQDPSNFTSNSVFVDQTIQFFASSSDDTKSKDVGFRELQLKCWEQYKLFGPLNAAVESTADYICGAGFEIYSDDLSLRHAILDLVFHPRNKLYLQHPSWIIRMKVEAELFLMIALDDLGLATIRVVEPSRIGQATDDGLVTDPDDASQAIFYKFYSTAGLDLIPDARFMVEPEFMLDRQKALQKLGKIDPATILKITKNPRFKKATGGYRRFIIHWKNLTGERNIRRDTSSLITTLKWINLYTKALEWELDYKKALAAYTIEVNFEDSPAGKVAWLKWTKMTDTQKFETGLTSPLTPGSRIYTMPGMKIILHAPQLSQGQGTNQPLLDLAGAGARTPQDLWQGQSAGATYASVKSTRPPLEAEIENLQNKFMLFHKYELMNCLLTVLSKIGKRVTYAGQKYKITDTYKRTIVTGWNAGTAQFQEADCYPHDLILYKFPQVNLAERPNDNMNAMLGSKHAGGYSLGVSATTAAKMIGVDGLSLEKEKQAIEQRKWGEPITGGQAERALETGKPADPNAPAPDKAPATPEAPGEPKPAEKKPAPQPEPPAKK